MSPETDDQEMLNELSYWDIKNFTWKSNEIERNAICGNALVPKNLYKTRRNQTWRYPPFFETEFEIDIGRESKINIDLIFGVPRFFEYYEKRNFKSIQLRSIRENKIRIPKGFAQFKFDGKSFDLLNQNRLIKKSATLEILKRNFKINVNDIIKKDMSENIIIPSESKIIHVYDENENQIKSTLSDDGETSEEIVLESFNKSIPYAETKLAVIFLKNFELKLCLKVSCKPMKSKKDRYKICFRLVNEGEVNKKWSRFNSVICPSMEISFEDTTINLNPQQYSEIIENKIKSSDENEFSFYDKNYKQMNCVLTKSTIDSNKIFCTTFGIFDTLRENPIRGPSLETLVKSETDLISNLSLLNKDEISKIQQDKNLINLIIALLKTIKQSFDINFLHKYQWEAIQKRIKILLGESGKSVVVIKAPTGAGKTIVFLASAALNSLYKKKRSVLIFPTRILNEDMFRRLTHFIYNLRINLNDSKNLPTGGIFIGSSDPLYKAISSPVIGARMIQYDKCPKCNNSSIIAKEVKFGRIVGECANKNCRHLIDYMFGSKEINDYLPDIVIATPDKLFYEATSAGYEEYHLRFFGGKYIRCGKCNYCQPKMGNRLQNSCKKCNSPLIDNYNRIQSSPIGLMILDEVHSLYGLTSSLLSIFFETLNIIYSLINNQRIDYQKTRFFPDAPSFETGTATISNELDLLEAICRIPREKINSFPEKSDFREYFKLDKKRVRYRTLILLPVSKSNRSTFSESLYSNSVDYRGDNLFFNSMIERKAKYLENQDLDSYKFFLGYLYRKNDGYTIKRNITDLARQNGILDLRPIFLSGDSSPKTISNILKDSINGDIEILIANLVISLGIDINNLNRIIMLGVPKDFTEFVQTIGRTGRGKVPGHISIHLLPSNPRDTFLYENFFEMMTDIEGYYDIKPTKGTNSYAAEIVFPNVFKSILAATSYNHNNYCLTASTYNQFVAKDRRRTLANFLAHIYVAMVPPKTPPGISKEIMNKSNELLNYYTNKFAKLSGKGHYISNILEISDLLFTLRPRSNTTVKVEITDKNLLEKMRDVNRIKINKKGDFKDSFEDDEG